MINHSNALSQEENKGDHIKQDWSWIKKVRTQVNQHHKQRAQTNKPCTIFRVQDNIRRCNPDAYTPLVVSIGPYHHQCLPMHSTVTAMENHKWFCLHSLLFRHRSRHNATELLDKCLLAMKGLDADVRSCYSDPLFEYLDAQSLAMIMLLDGCFILDLLLKQQGQRHSTKKEELVDTEAGENEMKVEDGEIILLDIGEEDEQIMEPRPLLATTPIWNFVLHDLLKHENQIPFFVLTTLYDLLKASGDESTVKLAFKLFVEIHPSKSLTFPALPAANQVHHLLHLFHSLVIPSVHHQCHHYQQQQQQQQLYISQAAKAREGIPSATELRLAGVKFVKKTNASSFLDISFRHGTMEIPELCVYDHTDTVFRNLIAFEQFYPGTSPYITIYAAFMDCIIDTPRDVRKLHLKGILLNRLSTDEAAADLFNKLCHQTHFAPDMNYLHELFVDVNKYYYSRWNKWRARLMRDYLSNPWAIISLIAAVALLLLTVEQSFFAAFSYFQPPS